MSGFISKRSVAITAMAAGCVGLFGMPACAAPKPRPVAAAPGPPPPPADRMVAGEPFGLTRTDPEIAGGQALAEFLGQVAPPLVACGLGAAARAIYRAALPDELELVVLLMEFPNADAARCGYDVDRPSVVSGLSGVALPAVADERRLRTIGPARVLLNVLKGRHVVRIFAPDGLSGRTLATRLAQGFAAELPGTETSPLHALLPQAMLVDGSARVTARSPLRVLDGLVALAHYECLSDRVTGVFSVRPTEEDAARVREDFQNASLEDFMTVNTLKLSGAPAVSAVTVDTHQETLLVQRGRLLCAIAGISRRSECLPAIDALASVALAGETPRPPPDAGEPPPEPAEETDAGDMNFSGEDLGLDGDAGVDAGPP